MKITWIAVLALAALLNACENLDDGPCTGELLTELTPTSATLLPEETVQTKYVLLTCGGTVELQDTDPTWTSENTEIATVDAAGLISAGFIAGSTDIVMEDTAYDVFLRIRISVPVVDPLP
jgi:hypothetical protein